MKLVFMAFMALFASQALAADGYQASNGETYPWCTDAAIDPDNDGWGWENDASCKVAPVVKEPVKVSEYGKGQKRIRVRTPSGSGLVRCYPAYTSDKDETDKYWSFVKIRPDNCGFVCNSLKYSYRSNSRSCARNQTVLACSFDYGLEFCEKNVTVY